MSASPMARQATESKSIPTRRVLINDSSELPSHYSSTPGGTLYSTTPGGTKIVYEKAFLMNLRNSPISKTPPNGIPDCLVKGSPNNNNNNKHRGGMQPPRNPARNNNIIRRSSETNHDEQFQMDI